MVMNDSTCRQLIEVYMESDKPILTMLVGIPSSGKSTIAARIKAYFPNTEIVSLEDVYEEVYGDARNEENLSIIYRICYDRIFHKLYEGVNVVFDACNISSERRQYIIKIFNNISTLVCIMQYGTLNEHLELNENKKGMPRSVIRRTFHQMCAPRPEEGFYKVIYNKISR